MRALIGFGFCTVLFLKLREFDAWTYVLRKFEYEADDYGKIFTFAAGSLNSLRLKKIIKKISFEQS